MDLFNKTIIILTFIALLAGCKNGKLPGADARKVPYSSEERVKRHLESGKGFRIDNAFKKKSGGNFEFASSNELWRASLDVIDFMPLASANYSGGMIITDWYSDSNNSDESIKLTIRFLTNQIRSDALSIKVFYKKCDQLNKCVVNEKTGNLAKELKREILKLAARYKTKSEKDNFQEYTPTNIKD